MKQTLVIIDTYSLWKECQASYGKRSKIDFKKLKNFLVQTRNADEEMSVHAYVLSAPASKNGPFKDMLRGNGYIVMEKFPAVRADGSFVDTGLSVEVTLAMLLNCDGDAFDSVVLVSAAVDHPSLFSATRLYNDQLRIELFTLKSLYAFPLKEAVDDGTLHKVYLLDDVCVIK